MFIFWGKRDTAILTSLKKEKQTRTEELIGGSPNELIN